MYKTLTPPCTLQCFIISIGLLNNLAFQFYSSAENLKQKIDFVFVKHASASGGSPPVPLTRPLTKGLCA
jgi:hypothetical protein